MNLDTLAIGHEGVFGWTTNRTRITYVRYSAFWHLNSKTNRDLEGFYEKGIDSPGALESENVNLFCFGVSVDHRLGSHLVLGFGYRYVKRDFDLPNLSYFEDRVLCTIGYDF